MLARRSRDEITHSKITSNGIETGQVNGGGRVIVQCHLDYTEKYDLDYTENKAHSLGVRKTVRVLSGKLNCLNQFRQLPLNTQTVFLTCMQCYFA